METITRSDLIKRTGISRRKLEYLDEKGLLSPVEHHNGLNNLYDISSEVTVKEIQLFEECGLRLSDIKKIMQLSDDEKAIKIRAQIPVLLEKVRHYQNMIAFAESYSTGTFKYDKESLLNMLNPDDYMKVLLSCYKNYSIEDRLHYLLRNFDINKKENAINSAKKIFKSFASIMHTDSKCRNETDSVVLVLQDFISKYFFPCKILDLYPIIRYAVSDTNVADFIEEIGGKGCIKFILDSVSSYTRRYLNGWGHNLLDNFKSLIELTDPLLSQAVITIMRENGMSEYDIASYEKIDVSDQRILDALDFISHEMSKFSTLLDISIISSVCSSPTLKEFIFQSTDMSQEAKTLFQAQMNLITRIVNNYVQCQKDDGSSSGGN